MMPIISEANQHQNEPEANLLFSKCKSINCNFINVLILLFKQMKKGHRDLNVANDQLSAPMLPYKPLI
jgi:hypothetical protein